MEDEGLLASALKPTSLELRHSNNSMIDKTFLIPPVMDISRNHDSNAISCIGSESTETTSGEAYSGEEKELKSETQTSNLSSDDIDAGGKVNEATALLQGINIGTMANGADKPEIDQPCAMYGQMIPNDDDTWELLSDAASWESSFPKDILNDYEQQCSSPKSVDDVDDLPPEWKKISSDAGSYYWNTESGVTQPVHPNQAISPKISIKPSTKDTIKVIDECKAVSDIKKNSHRWSGNSRDGHLFLVRSLGWLPIEHENLKPDVSSAAVNACIRLLSNNRSQIMDGVGVWGEGKDLMLLLNEDNLKIVDPLENTVLQSQPIKHIRVWGVGRDSAHDFAYVVRDTTTKIYKCHVFRCDAPAHAIAKQLHAICSLIVKQKRLADHKGAQAGVSVTADNADEIPMPSAEPTQTFQSKYMGELKVSKPSGIDILKQAIVTRVKDMAGDGQDVQVSVSPSALIINDDAGNTIVNCRMRCLSFMGVGDDVQFFGFISVLAGEATCHVLRCIPNAAKLGLAVQEACMLRYQKAIDSKQPMKNSPEPQQGKSLKTKVLKLFSGWRHGRS